jgi:nicotinate-nucleotide--dimethylbenzimidazole phosphoribosyltransferase
MYPASAQTAGAVISLPNISVLPEKHPFRRLEGDDSTRKLSATIPGIKTMARKPAASLAEMRGLLTHLPGPDLAAGTTARMRERELTKPAGALGRLEELAAWCATWQGRHPPQVERPRTCVFAGNHGVAALGVSAYPAAVTAQMVRNFTAGGAAVNQLCKVIDADLRVFEMALEQPTQDFTKAAAMTEEECARAMAYGMMAVEPGIDVLALGEMGIANTTSAAALCLALFGGTAADWVGPGTGVSGTALQTKTEVVAAGVALHRSHFTDPLEVLRRLGGHELAALAGAILAARMARIPVILDGFACTAAAAVLYALDKKTLDHCVVAHVSAEPGHRRLLQQIDKTALLDLGMRLGEGSGATLAIALLKSAIACHTGMATFAEAGVSGKS